MSVLGGFFRKAYKVAKQALGGGEIYVDEAEWHRRVKVCAGCEDLREERTKSPIPKPTEAEVVNRGICNHCECPIRRLALFNIDPADLCHRGKWSTTKENGDD